LHSHLVREQPKTVSELYDQFAKFNKYEVQHFRKLEQQRKVSKSDEALRNRYGDNQCNYPRPVHNIGPNGDIPLENWGKNSGGPPLQRDPRTFDQISPQYNQRGRASNRGLLRNSFIHAHHFSVRPFILNVCCRNGQFTLSYTFSKSNFRITPFIFSYGVLVLFHAGSPPPPSPTFDSRWRLIAPLRPTTTAAPKFSVMMLPPMSCGLRCRRRRVTV
jgi:hypothetical protein